MFLVPVASSNEKELRNPKCGARLDVQTRDRRGVNARMALTRCECAAASLRTPTKTPKRSSRLGGKPAEAQHPEQTGATAAGNRTPEAKAGKPAAR